MMNLQELAAYVCTHLERNGIRVVLSGGACVSVYTENRYPSFDLDFIENMPTTPVKLKKVMGEIGFTAQQRYFKHPDTGFFVEFPPGPITVGDEPAGAPNRLSFKTGTLLLLSPTDCVKDRLAGFYHWNDLQCLEQAVIVAEKQAVDIHELERWSEKEGKREQFLSIRGKLVQQR